MKLKKIKKMQLNAVVNEISIHHMYVETLIMLSLWLTNDYISIFSVYTLLFIFTVWFVCIIMFYANFDKYLKVRLYLLLL